MNSSSGAKMQKSASLPTAMPPFEQSPASAAGCSDIHLTTSARLNPLVRAPLQTIDKASCSEEIPLQALPKSPSTRVFIEAGLGEWSETTRSSTPPRRPCHNSSRFASSRIGGAHLKRVSPSLISSEENVR